MLYSIVSIYVDEFHYGQKNWKFRAIFFYLFEVSFHRVNIILQPQLGDILLQFSFPIIYRFWKLFLHPQILYFIIWWSQDVNVNKISDFSDIHLLFDSCFCEIEKTIHPGYLVELCSSFAIASHQQNFRHFGHSLTIWQLFCEIEKSIQSWCFEELWSSFTIVRK